MCMKYFQNWTKGYRYGVDTNSVHVIIDLHYDLDFEAGCRKPSLGRLLNMVDISVKYNQIPTGDFKILGKIDVTDRHTDGNTDGQCENRIPLQTHWSQIKIITTYCYNFHDMYNRHNK